MNTDNIAILRYIIIPSAGFLISIIFFLFVYQKKYSEDFLKKLELYSNAHLQKTLIFSISLYCLFFLSIINLRYFSGHLGLFDFGIYDKRIWLIEEISWSDWPQKFKSLITGHFQPILLIYSLFYEFGIEPVVLNILQAVVVISGIIPLYLIAKARLKNQFFILLISLFYLFYPATQFNIAIDFHPDNIIIPLLLWCYYLIEKDKYLWTALLVVVGYTIKEPLILVFAFLGLYIVWEKRKYVYGIALFFISLIVFYVVLFKLIPAVSSFKPSETITDSATFGYIFQSKHFVSVAKEIFRFEKWRFLFFLLFPLLFIPLLRKEFLPAIPLLAIPLLSTVVHHQNVASHYTAGIIPPLFVSFISAVANLNNKLGSRAVTSILSSVGVLLLAFNIAHSPSPIGISFWNKNWSHGKWHYTNYLKDEHTEILKDAIELIPEDPSIKVMTHSEIYHKRLAHRYFYKPFPEKWEEADYILLDNSRGSYVMDTINEDVYNKELRKLWENTRFKLIFMKDEVVLFKRVQ